MKPKRLGRGLSGLINRTDAPPPTREGAAAEAPAQPALETTAEPGRGPVREVAVAEIRANPFQPRQTFSPEGLAELADSLREHGVLQPLVVRPLGDDDGFELVAGERRLRAAKEIGLTHVPVVVRATTDEEMQTLALVENVQRVDLNPIEKAAALRAMMRGFGLTQEQVAKRVAKARTTIANILRLLDLEPDIQELVTEGAISGAHGRALLAMPAGPPRQRLAREVVRLGLSVREVERRARVAKKPLGSRARGGSGEGDPYLADLQRRIGEALATQVTVKRRGKKGGMIEIPWHSDDELGRLLEHLGAD